MAYDDNCDNCNTDKCFQCEKAYQIKNQMDCAKVSLDKFFDSEYSGDLCNMAVDAREIFCKVGDMLDKAEAERDRYRDALEPLLKRYVDLANSGDAGFWDPECEKEVIQARTALKESQ